MKERNHAVFIDSKRSPLIHRFLESQLVSFIQDVIPKESTLQFDLKPIKIYDDLVLLIMPEGMYIVRKDELGFIYLLTLEEARAIYDIILEKRLLSL